MGASWQIPRAARPAPGERSQDTGRLAVFGLALDGQRLGMDRHLRDGRSGAGAVRIEGVGE